MNTRKIKTLLMGILGERLLVYIQAFRFLYLIVAKKNRDPEVQLLARFLDAGDIAIDVGANGANWTYFINRIVRKEGHVYAFEADPYYAKATDLTVKLLRLKGVTVFPFGLSDRNETVSLRVAGSNGRSLSGESHVVRNIPLNQKGTRNVRLRSLDSIIPEFPNLLVTALIKCDVEGYELFVLKGAAEVIKKARPLIIIEVGHYEKHGYSAIDMYNYFRERDYSPYAMTSTNRISQTDNTLEHKEALSVNRIVIPNEKSHVIKHLI